MHSLCATSLFRFYHKSSKWAIKEKSIFKNSFKLENTILYHMLNTFSKLVIIFGFEIFVIKYDYIAIIVFVRSEFLFFTTN